jgi:cobalt-zinc-cadmium efflux system protein
MDGVKDFHHIHIWAISTTQNALTGHLVLSEKLNNIEISKIKAQIKHELEHLNIQHTTLETEFENENCDQADC